MGRQINFFQIESDIQDLLFFLDEHQINIFDSEGNILTEIEDLYEQRMVAINKKHISRQIGIANSPVEYKVPCMLDKMQITEVRFYRCDSLNYELKNIEGMKVIREGRFYLANEYYSDESTVRVYNLLKSYIRKNYIYSKKWDSYFSRKFIEEYRKNNVFAANGTNVYSITDV